MTSTVVRWEELLPREFVERQRSLPLVYLPMGLCEPHGHGAAFGLDTLKAVWLCEEAAIRFGGIVAPTQGYHIHETGYHRPWLSNVVGNNKNPHLGSVPPDIVLKMLLFQLRAFLNAGFRHVLVLTGHHGNQPDLRLVAEELMRDRPLRVIAVSDPELVSGRYRADHAGRYELSQLMYIRPDLVDLDRLDDADVSSLGRFAQGVDGAEATAVQGQVILENSLDEIGRLIADWEPVGAPIDFLSIEETQEIWQRVLARSNEWWTLRDWHPDHDPELRD